MRDHLAHRYFDTDHAIVAATIEQDLPPLLAAARRLFDAGDDEPSELDDDAHQIATATPDADRDRGSRRTRILGIRVRPVASGDRIGAWSPSE